MTQLQNAFKRNAKSLSALLVALAATACSSLGSNPQASDVPPGGQWLNANRSVIMFSSDHSSRISKANTGEQVYLGDTPFGIETTFVRTITYFSATGRECFEALIKTAGTSSESSLICQYPGNTWGATRDLRYGSMR